MEGKTVTSLIVPVTLCIILAAIIVWLIRR